MLTKPLSWKMRLTLSYTAVLFIAIVSGTQYLFSAYGPALADRLKLSSTQTNIIASAGNYGLFLTSPINGYLADNYGPRRVCLAGSFLIFTSFLCLALTFDGLLPQSFLLCALYLMLSGVASSAGFMSALTTAVSVSIRVGFVEYTYNSTAMDLSHDTYRFLLCIAISTGICQFIGSCLLDPISLESITDDDLSETTQQSSNASVEAETNRYRQLAQNEETPSLRSIPGEQRLEINTDAQSEQTPLLRQLPKEPEISGWRLILNNNAQLLFLAIIFLGGAGLMYINNVGTIAKLLYASSSRNRHGIPNKSHELQHIQNFHVFLLSIFSCTGRLSSGVLSDITRSMYDIRRLWFIIIAGVLLLIGQILAGFIATSLKTLWLATICIGFGYGCIFGIAPAITSEWFGLQHFGFNWGIMAC
ncbi:9952_t:CDS:2, partial [Paraglomus occultum]